LIRLLSDGADVIILPFDVVSGVGEELLFIFFLRKRAFSVSRTLCDLLNSKLLPNRSSWNMMECGILNDTFQAASPLTPDEA
jgi:hypothetical protein